MDGSSYSYRHHAIDHLEPYAKRDITKLYDVKVQSTHMEYVEELYNILLKGNSTESYRCTAITHNLFKQHQWLPIDCDRNFTNVAFLCEVPQGKTICRICEIYMYIE